MILSICAKTFVAVIILAFPYFFWIKLAVFLSKYLRSVGIPFLMASLPIFSGVTPNLLIFVVFGYPKFLYQDYLEPLVYLLLFCGVLKTDLLDLVKKYFNKVIITYSVYLTLYNLAVIIYFNYYLT